jgi:hypothetical protein
MNWKGYGRKREWTNLKYHPCILSADADENHKTPAEI